MKLKVMGKSILAGVLVAGMISFSLTACSPKTEQDTTTASRATTQAVSDAQSTAEPGEEGVFAVEGKDVFDEEVSTQYFKDHNLTMVNLFSVTCNPCMAELPDMIEIAEEMKDKGFAVLAVSADVAEDGTLDPEAANIIKELVGEKKENFKAMYLGMDMTMDLLEKSGSMIPYTFFVDKDGMIVGENYLGGKTGDDWREVINQHFELVNQ